MQFPLDCRTSSKTLPSPEHLHDLASAKTCTWHSGTHTREYPCLQSQGGRGPGSRACSSGEHAWGSWSGAGGKFGTSLGKDVSTFLVECDDGIPLVHDPCPEYGDQMVEAVRQEEPQIFALTRNRFPQQPPTGKLLGQIKAQMLRVHKAAGHPSMANLQRMLRARRHHHGQWT